MSFFLKYCLDTNVLIKAWEGYYAPSICPTYWDRLDELGERGIIFVPAIVAKEIYAIDDDLAKWLKRSRIPKLPEDAQVAANVRAIFAKADHHKFLVDNVRQRSLADPWVIAHALKHQSSVVTKEIKILESKGNKIRIPNVCEAMGVRCIDDFTFIRELAIRFSCDIAIKE